MLPLPGWLSGSVVMGAIVFALILDLVKVPVFERLTTL
jgi:hypothetical protein